MAVAFSDGEGPIVIGPSPKKDDSPGKWRVDYDNTSIYPRGQKCNCAIHEGCMWCCSKCNYDTHDCPFGHNTGHDGVCKECKGGMSGL